MADVQIPYAQNITESWLLNISVWANLARTMAFPTWFY